AGRRLVADAVPPTESPSPPFSISSPLYPDRIFFFSFSKPPSEFFTLSLHDALPICCLSRLPQARGRVPEPPRSSSTGTVSSQPRSEEHTSELQSRGHLVCRLLLEKKNRIP